MKKQLETTGNKIIDIHKLKSKIVIYFIDDKFSISPFTFTEFNLYVNKILTDKELKDIKSFDNYQKDLNYALNLINKYSYTTYKLEKKLKEKEISAINIKKIMEYINKYHLINDEEFAKMLANDLVNKHKGEIFIKNKLFQLGIDEEINNKIIANVSKDDLKDNAVKLIKSLDDKYSKRKIINKKEKIYASLKQHGYSNYIISEAFKSVMLKKINISETINNDYLKFKRMYDDNSKIINALKRKGYSYSKIKEIIKENSNDLY